MKRDDGKSIIKLDFKIVSDNIYLEKTASGRLDCTKYPAAAKEFKVGFPS